MGINLHEEPETELRHNYGDLKGDIYVSKKLKFTNKDAPLLNGYYSS